MVVRNAIPAEMFDIFKYYFTFNFFINESYNINAGNLMSNDVVLPFSKSKYADPLVESLLITMTEKMNEYTGKELIPTYSFCRYYENGQYLVKHKDRPSCQYSVTAPLFTMEENEEPWTIFIGDNPIQLNNGDIVIYKGQEVEHWREPYNGELHVQAHLHYVDSKDPEYEKFFYDGRYSCGYDKDKLKREYSKLDMIRFKEIMEEESC